MKKFLPLLVLLVLAVTTPPVEAQPLTTYYELVELGYVINLDRTLNVSENYTIYNSSMFTYNYTITRRIPTENTRDVSVWSDTGELTSEVKRVPGRTEITISFTLSGRSGLTYRIRYTADNMVFGTGPLYRSRFGGVTLERDDWPYQRYVVRVHGPAGSRLFLTDPENAVVLEDDPLTVQYETSVDAPGSFGGLETRFYTEPVFYRLTLDASFTNVGTSSTTDLRLDTILFNNEATWQFSALTAPSHPVETMYVDEENNWHGVFKISELAPGKTEVIRLELLCEVKIHDPSISEQDSGTISQVPAQLENYLKPKDKWESDDLTIQQAAQDAIKGETNAYLAAKRISDYVVNRLDWEAQDKRRGALWAFTEKRGDCSEYTDLSIALARAAGIPARAMYGWGYQKENTGPHAWPQFYFPNVGWQPADPTWAETSGNYFAKLDPIHLTRNVRGLISDEAGTSITYYGPRPTFKENVWAEVLETSEAAQEFVRAAQYAVDLADNLLAISPSEALQAKQTLAKQALSQAQTVTDENQKIFYAKNSLQYAGEVIRALGKPPAPPTISIEFEKLLPFLVVIGVIAAVALGGYAIWRRR